MSKNVAEEYMALNAAVVEPELNQLGKADDFMDTFHKLRGESASDADGRCRALEEQLVAVGNATEKLRRKRQSAEARLSSRLGAQETMSQIVAETEGLSRKLDGDRRELAEAGQRLAATDAEVERTSRMAKDVVEKSAKFRNLQAMKHFLYRVTRTNWEPPKEKDGDNVVRGFVINPQQRDIITFKVDRRDHNEDYLWSCIASGSDPVWRGTR